jgi:uncharacterized protein
MYPRIVNPLKSNIFFLFGARGVGKSTFLNDFFKSEKVLWIDLLSYEIEERYQANPDLLFDQITSQKEQYNWCVIDEIQKIPKLLDIVHKILETKNVKTKFALTGSSARKLKMGAANLTAGRVFQNVMFPLSFFELSKDFDLSDVLNFGALPKLYELETEEEKKEFLRSYVQTYLKEEVWSEQLIRDLTPFRKFLEVASQHNGEILNYSKISRLVNADIKTVQKYYQILEDTFVGFYLEAYHTSLRKKLIEAPKFYLFDLGVKRALDKSLNIKMTSGNYGYGKAFEHLVITQMMFLNYYFRLDYTFHYFKTRDGAEIDLVVTRPGLPIALIEIKSSTSVDETELTNLKSLNNEMGKKSEAYCLSLDKIERQKDGVNYFFWENGIAVIMQIDQKK